MLPKDGIDPKDPYIALLLHGYISKTLEMTIIWSKNEMKGPIELLLKASYYDLMPNEIQALVFLHHMRNNRHILFLVTMIFIT